ncbi:MAG: hypothetical protein IT200_10635 [Thermoleophilia bacterium]|nr:hypothetical protein [Thermoleophilia bacterium]
MRGAVAAAALVATAAYVAVAHRLPSAGGGDGAAILEGVAGLVPVLAATVACALAPHGRRVLVVSGAAGLAAAVAGVLLDAEAVATPGRLLAAAAVGAALASLVSSPPQLAVLAVAAGVADAVSVALGPTGYAAERAPELLRAAGLRLPGWSGPPDGLLGAVAVAILGLLIAGSRRTGLPVGRTAAACCAGVAAGLAAAVLLDTPVPAIPAISVMFLGVNAAGFLARTGREGGGRA